MTFKLPPPSTLDRMQNCNDTHHQPRMTVLIPGNYIHICDSCGVRLEFTVIEIKGVKAEI